MVSRCCSRSIEDQQDNTTRFLVIGRELFSPSGDDKTTLLLTGDEGPGSAARPARPAGRHQVNMSRIESRPAPQRKWQYVFFIDVDGHAEEEPVENRAGGDGRRGRARPPARFLSAGSAWRAHPERGTGA